MFRYETAVILGGFVGMVALGLAAAVSMPVLRSGTVTIVELIAFACAVWFGGYAWRRALVRPRTPWDYAAVMWTGALLFWLVTLGSRFAGAH